MQQIGLQVTKYYVILSINFIEDLYRLEEPRRVTLSEYYSGMERQSFLSQQRPQQFMESLYDDDSGSRPDYKSVLAAHQKVLRKTTTTGKTDKDKVKCVAILLHCS